MSRNLLYTGVNRGKRLVVLVGQRKAVATAIHGVSGRRWWSELREWLRRKFLIDILAQWPHRRDMSNPC
jgi:hypothetical protein